MVVSSRNRNSRHPLRSVVICTIRPNFTTKLNSDSSTQGRISSVNERNGEAEAE